MSARERFVGAAVDAARLVDPSTRGPLYRGPEVVRRRFDDGVFFAIEYLEDIVDRRLERAAEKVIAAVRAEGADRTESFGQARADYAAAHVVASLVDDRCYDANEWPVFTAWAAELMRTIR